MSRTIRLCAVLTAGIVLAASCTDNKRPTAGRRGCTWTLGTLGALSGDYAVFGTRIYRGIQYAIDKANRQDDLACRVRLRARDTQGSSARAPELARELSEKDSVIALIGPYFSGETLAAGPILDRAGIPFICPSCTDPIIAEQGFSTFFRAVADDPAEGSATGDYIVKALRPNSVVVVHDRTRYGSAMATAVKGALAGLLTGAITVPAGAETFGEVVSEIKRLDPQVVYYGGYVAQAGILARELDDSGVKVVFVSDSRAHYGSFGRIAGDAAADRSLVACSCIDATRVPAASQFVRGMEKKFDELPGAYAAEAYDATKLVLAALGHANASATADELRASVLNYLGAVSGYRGITKPFTFDSQGDAEVEPTAAVWIYRWDTAEEGFLSLGPTNQLIQR
jgi:branched-chain amino acid transport system substrate-binding protein